MSFHDFTKEELACLDLRRFLRQPRLDLANRRYWRSRVLQIGPHAPAYVNALTLALREINLASARQATAPRTEPPPQPSA